MTRPSSSLYWLAAAIIVFAAAETARADVVDEATTACKAKNTAAKMDRLLGTNDMRTYRKFVDASVKVGDCKPLKAYTEVKVDKRDGDLACVKAKGDNRCSWLLETNLRITNERRLSVRQDYIACKTQLYLATGRKILADNDQDAARRFRIATNQSGQCLALKKGEQVDVERRDGTVLCIRPSGEDQCYWTDDTVLPANLADQGSGSSASGGRVGVRRNSRKPK